MLSLCRALNSCTSGNSAEQRRGRKLRQTKKAEIIRKGL